MMYFLHCLHWKAIWIRETHYEADPKGTDSQHPAVCWCQNFHLWCLLLRRIATWDYEIDYGSTLKLTSIQRWRQNSQTLLRESIECITVAVVFWWWCWTRTNSRTAFVFASVLGTVRWARRRDFCRRRLHGSTDHSDGFICIAWLQENRITQSRWCQVWRGRISKLLQCFEALLYPFTCLRY